MRVVAQGRIDLFEQQGAYQLYVESLQPAGVGDLAQRYEALKERLTAEGLFDSGSQTPAASLAEDDRRGHLGRAGPSCTTSAASSAAAGPWRDCILSPCQVQGAGAERSIVRALSRLGRWTDPLDGRAVDLVIVARGGGSLEDLWAFNDEAVVRAIAGHARPVIVGVGHETDVTLAEFAADRRAATPSVAAELAVPDQSRAAAAPAGAAITPGHERSSAPGRVRARTCSRSDGHWRPSARGLPRRRARTHRTAVRSRHPRAAGPPRRRPGRDGALGDRLPSQLLARTSLARAQLTRSAAGLEALSPFATLERGYAIVRGPGGRVVVDAARQRAGDHLEIRLAKGALDVSVDGVRDSGS